MAITLIDLYEYDTSQGQEPEIIHISGNVYAIVYRGPVNEGWLKTVEVADNGTITTPFIDSYEFSPGGCWRPEILHVSGDVYAICYSGVDSDGWLNTLTIAANGTIGANIDTLEWETTFGDEVSFRHVSGNIYLWAYRDMSANLLVKTVDIDNAGNIGATVIDTHQIRGAECYQPWLCHISGDIWAVVYRGSNDGIIHTFNVDISGNIGANIDGWTFDTGSSAYPNLLHISGTVYTIFYNNPSKGMTVTLNIADNGTITKSFIDSYNFFTIAATYGFHTIPYHISGDYLTAFWETNANDLYLYVLTIASNGTITKSSRELVKFYAVYGANPSIVHIAGETYGIAHEGAANDGYLRTLGVPEVKKGGSSSALPIFAKMLGV